MGRIYQNAFEVVVWLGPATKNSDDVMDAIADYDIRRIKSEEFANDFAELLRRSWFFRTWTIQEFVLVKFPPMIQCGAKVVTSGQFLAVHTFLGELRYQSDKIKSEVGWQPTDTVSLSMKDDRFLEHPTTGLIDLRSAILNSEGTPERRSLAKILTYYRSSQVKYIADKVYGTLGLVDEIVHDHIKASSTKSVSETYTDAMTYIINVETEKYHVEVLELYLNFPCSLTVSGPTPGLPSWVPEFSRNNMVLDLYSNYVWFWLHQITRYDGRKPRAELRHGIHQITTKRIDRSMYNVYDNVLFVRGYIVDDIAEIVQSAYCRDLVQESESTLDQFFEQTEETRRAGEQLKPLLDQYRSVGVSEVFSNASNPNSPLFKILLAAKMLQSINLRQVERTCRKVWNLLGIDTPEDEWMTHIWSDLFEGYNEIPKLSEAQFRAGIHYLAGSRSPKIPSCWSENGGNPKQLIEEASQAALQLVVTFKGVFNAPKCFFMTKDSGVYGIGTPGVMDHDKVAFLFPPLYMVFVLRPHGKQYRLVGPCFVPPLRRDIFMTKVSATGRKLDEFHIV